MNVIGHFLGELTAVAVSSTALEAGYELGRFVLTLLP